MRNYLLLLILEAVISGLVSPYLFFQSIFLALALFVIVIPVAFIFQHFKWAAQSAMVFSVAALTGLFIAGGLAFISIPFQIELTTPLVVLLIVIGLIGGSIPFAIFIKKNISNPSFKRNWLKYGNKSQ